VILAAGDSFRISTNPLSQNTKTDIEAQSEMAGLFVIPPHVDKHLLRPQYIAASSLFRNSVRALGGI